MLNITPAGVDSAQTKPKIEIGLFQYIVWKSSFSLQWNESIKAVVTKHYINR